MDAQTPFRRDPEHKLVAGICGALAQRLGMEPTWLRLGVALLAVFTGGFIIWAYAILWMITPLGTAGTAPLQRWIASLGRLFRSSPSYPAPPDHV